MKTPKIQADEFEVGMRIRWWKHRTYNSSVMTVIAVRRNTFHFSLRSITLTEIDCRTPTGRLITNREPGDKFILVTK